jgi:hypothetical protein
MQISATTGVLNALQISILIDDVTGSRRTSRHSQVDSGRDQVVTPARSGAKGRCINLHIVNNID